VQAELDAAKAELAEALTAPETAAMDVNRLRATLGEMQGRLGIILGEAEATIGRHVATH
jgi:hypothetical protein